KIWFDRADLNVSRLESFAPKGVLLSDVKFSNWQTPDPGTSGTAPASTASIVFPRAIRIDRPHDDYRLHLQFTKVVLNEVIPAERFNLDQPAGSDLVKVESNKPSSDSNQQNARHNDQKPRGPQP